MTNGDITNLYEAKKLLRLLFPKLTEEDLKEIMKAIMEKEGG